MIVAILVYPGMTALDALGPYEVLRQGEDIEIRFVWKEAGPIVTDSGVLAADAEQLALGWEYVKSFVLASGSGTLIAFPLTFLVVGKLTPTGRRALLGFITWSVVVGLSGGDALPMWNALAPALPLLFLAIQETISRAIDARASLAPAAFVLVALGMAASFLVSKSRTGLVQTDTYYSVVLCSVSVFVLVMDRVGAN